MTLANHAAIWLACAAPLAIAALYFYDRRRREQLTRRIGELPVLGRVLASVSPRRRAIKMVLQMCGVALVLVAIARPQIAGKRKVELRGLDLVVAVDVSKSMLVDDVESTFAMAEKSIAATRLARARELAAALIDELPGDRIAPVVFAGAAVHFPLTEDHEVAARFLADLGPADIPPGSNLAEVFRVSRCLLRPDLYDDLGCARIGRRGRGGAPLPGESLDPADAPKQPVIEQKIERGKAIVVLTDGGDPDDATKREVATARELGIAVILVGMGTTAGGVVHEIDGNGNPTAQVKHDRDGATVTSKRDDDGMRALAAVAGDDKRYLVAADRGELDPMPIVAALRAVDRGLATKQVDELRDVYQPFLFAGLMLLVIEAAIGTRRRRAYPEER